MVLKDIELKPLNVPTEYLDEIERRVRDVFFKEVYEPIIKMLAVKLRIKNDTGYDDALWKALHKGTVTYNRGKFSGKFDAHTTKALRKLGAKWNRSSSTFSLPIAEMPKTVQAVIRSTESAFSAKVADIADRIRQIVPEKVAEKILVSDLFDKTIFRVDSEFRKNVERIMIQPEITPAQRKVIADKWQENTRTSAKKFTEEQMARLRKNIEASIRAGDRYGSLVGSIKTSFGVSANKAKFIARQETRLFTSVYHEARLKEAGVTEYKWKSVIGSPAHPVRKRHKELNDMSEDGKVFRFDDPPVSSDSGQPVRRNNPGHDFNCRCRAIPVLRFKK